MPSALVVGTNTYVTLAEANTYMQDSIQGWLLWEAAGPDSQTRGLITAFRAINPLLTGVDPLNAPAPVKEAQILYAFYLTQDAALEASTSTGSNIKEAHAGPAGVEFFRPTAGARFPARVAELLAPYLGSGVSEGAAFGSDAESAFDDADGYELTEGLP